MEPKWVPKWSQNQAPERGASGRASGSDLGGFWRPKKLPRGSRERPGRTPGASQEAQRSSKTSPRRPQNDPQEGPNEPQEGQSELREVPGGFRERFGLVFAKKCNTFHTKTSFLEVRGIPK